MVNVSAARPLIRGIHYRELSVREGGADRFELRSQPIEFLFDAPVLPDGEVRSFRARDRKSGFYREWLRLESRKGIVMPYYRWNGNSIKKVICGVRVGTLDFQDTEQGSTIEKSLFHDTLFQFSSLEELTEVFSLAAANHAYRTIEGRRPFRLNNVYCWALDQWSAGSWGKIGDSDSEVTCVISKP
jgi:hypothetical protein